MTASTEHHLTHTTTQNCIQDFIPDWANQFYQAKKAEGISPYTLTFYKQQLGHFLKYCEAQVITRVEEITPNVIRLFLLWHEETGHNPGGLHAAYRVLRTFLFWYDSEVEPEGWKNPIKKVKAPKVPTKILEPVDIKDVSTLLDTCKLSTFFDYRDRALLLFLFDSGVRARELLKINLEDVNLVNGSVIIREGKGRKPRTVFLGKLSRKAIRAYVKQRRDENLALWVTDDAERITYGGLRAIIVRRAKLAGIHPPSLHSFRRAFAINMLRAEVNIYSLQALMGHSDIKTLKHYLKLSDDDLTIAHQKGSPVDRNL
jgi:integrase/recombinase XerD